jgi:hypothetical protein
MFCYQEYLLVKSQSKFCFPYTYVWAAIQGDQIGRTLAQWVFVCFVRAVMYMKISDVAIFLTNSSGHPISYVCAFKVLIGSLRFKTEHRFQLLLVLILTLNA